MKIYIAGKITGDPDYKKKFAEAAGAVKNTYPNAVIINPAEHPEGLSAAEYMRLCFAEIDMADAVAFLQDWMESGGARLEEHYCEYIGKPRIYIVVHDNGKYRYLSVPYVVKGEKHVGPTELFGLTELYGGINVVKCKK